MGDRGAMTVQKSRPRLRVRSAGMVFLASSGGDESKAIAQPVLRRRDAGLESAYRGILDGGL